MQPRLLERRLAACAIAGSLVACGGGDDVRYESTTQHVEGQWGCSKQEAGGLVFVAEGEDGCDEATLLAYPVDPRSEEVELHGGNAAGAQASNHAAAVQSRLNDLAGTNLYLPNKDKDSEVKFKGKLTTEAGIKLQTPFFEKLGLPGISATFKTSGTTELQVSFGVKDSMTLFVSDPHGIGPVIDRFVENCGEWQRDGEWLLAHSHITIWHTTSLTDGAASAAEAVRTLSAQLESKGTVPIAPVGSVEDSASLSWKKTNAGTWAVRRIFPLPESVMPAGAEGDGDDDIESAPGVARFPWTAHGIAKRLLRPSIGDPVQCRRGREGKDGMFPMYFKDEAGKLEPVLCYERSLLYRELFRNMNPLPAVPSDPMDIAGLLVPGQWFWVDERADRSRLGKVHIKESMWDRIPILDRNLQPSDLVNNKGQKVAPKACNAGLPRCPEGSGTAPYHGADGSCRCVPSVGHKAREAFAKYAIPFLELVARDGGAFGPRQIPDYTAKIADNGSVPLIDVVHGCWCDITLVDRHTHAAGEIPISNTFKKDTGYDIVLVPPAAYTGFCHQLDGKRVGSDLDYGFGWVMDRSITITGCIRVEVPYNTVNEAADKPNCRRPNCRHYLGRFPKTQLGDGWRYIVGTDVEGYNNAFSIGRRWQGALEDEVSFKGKVGSTKQAGSWQVFPKTEHYTFPQPHGWPRWKLED